MIEKSLTLEEVVLAFKHLDFNCHWDFDIWVYLVFGA